MANTALVKEIGNHRQLFGLLAAAGLAGGLAAIVQAKFLADIVDGVFLGGLGLGAISPWLYGMLAAIMARAFFIWAGDLLGFRLAAHIKNELRRRLLAQLFALGPVETGRESSGELINTLGEGIESFDAYFAKYLPQLAATILLPPVILAVVFSLDLAAAAIMLVTAPLIPLFMILIGRWAGFVQQRHWLVLSRLSGHFFDVLQGLATLKIFNRSEEQAAVIQRLSEEFRDTTLNVLKVAFLSAFALELLSTLSTALVAVVIGLKLLYGQLEFHQAFFILLLAPEYYLPLRLLGSHFHAGLAANTAAERVFAILARALPAADSGRQSLPLQSAIGLHFEQVAFSYSDRPVLDSLTFSVRPGERLALVGPSGAGKSTILDLLLGFIQPAGGSITVNGQDLQSLTLSEWRSQVAYVPQFPHLFFGTVADNISFGLADGQERVEEAARSAGAHEFICRLPSGYQTVIGEGGRALSGGESQRIAIARAFFKNAPLLLLDEATTGLDPGNEALIGDALTRLMTGKTVIVVAHRLSTACQADRILVLDAGQVVETGSHQDLFTGQGLYHQMITAYRGSV
ncbi:MAG: thiol reductant ABC exporter subunit CydD [Negativicutes bacterium]|nr:thiol reductant ABC exporter subunit CydD [Negativicutes bacterium]